ncbi:hypothetical protein [Rhizobium sp. SYY.PMSO]|uniref:hypothetical protein n=1 Tax=Rhizobium sp. SYY.PMSO TaxID=3382192 RepID=UPI00398F8E64
MTNLEMQIITYPALPSANITPLELLVLSCVLECSQTEDGLVLLTDTGPVNSIHLRRRELFEAFHASTRNCESTLQVFIASRVLVYLPDGDPDAGEVRLAYADLRLREEMSCG